MLDGMSDVTQLLCAIDRGDPQAGAELLPLVYDELRKLAAARLAAEQPGQTLQATALVHEAYLRLVGDGTADGWNGRGHFFGAAAEAMRRILIDRARARRTGKRGGGWHRLDLDALAAAESADDLLDFDDALTRFRTVDSAAARLVELRFFAGLTMPEAAAALGVPLRTAERDWTFARTWLHRALAGG
jgi:RNA polymerase sigma factor (TIGR02999 family)